MEYFPIFLLTRHKSIDWMKVIPFELLLIPHVIIYIFFPFLKKFVYALSCLLYYSSVT